MGKQTILFVDAFSGARHLPSASKKIFGTRNLHCFSSTDLPDYYRNNFDSSSIDESLPGEDFDQLIQHAKTNHVTAVIAGAETGVLLAESLASHLGLTTNDPLLANARRNKFEMHQACAAKGLRIPKQFSCETIEDLKVAFQAIESRQKVLKPAASAGSDGLNIVDTLEQAETCFRNSINTLNKLGLKNAEILLQEYIDGPEYAVNSITKNEHTFILNIWKYHKRTEGTSKIYDWEEFVSPSSEEGRVVSRFATSVTKAVGIHVGAAHTEVMVDQRGPVLIETSARVDGITNPEFETTAFGVSQVELTLSSYLESEHDFAARTRKYQEQGFQGNIALIQKHHIQCVKNVNSEILRALPGVFDFRLNVKLGQSIEPTTDLFSSPGFLYLNTKTKEEFLNSLAKLRGLEVEGKLFS